MENVLLAIFMLFVFAVVFACECIVFGWRRIVARPFWIFTFFFAASYPIRFILINSGVAMQKPITPDEPKLITALWLSFLFWISILINGYFIHYFRPPFSKQIRCFQSNSSFRIIILSLMILASAYFYFLLLKDTGFALTNAYIGNEQNELRKGAGLFFVLGELYFIAFIAVLFSQWKKGWAFVSATILSVAILSVLNMVLLATRRPIYLAIYVLILAFTIHKNSGRSYLILALYPVISALASPIGQVLRYSFHSLLAFDFTKIDLTYAVTSFGSTFEGVEHLAQYLKLATTNQILFGVDYGESYIFNIVLSLIPRALWHSKPEVYGSIALQDFLYNDGAGVSTFPSGIVMDALYGFGLIGFFLYAFFVACLLFMVEGTLFLKKPNSEYWMPIAAYTYVNLFNLVRGGTGLGQAVVFLLFFLVILRISGTFRFRGRAERIA